MAVKTKPRVKRPRRWFRRVLVVLLTLTVAYVVVTRTALTKWIALAQASKMLGGEASAESVVWDADGHLTIREAEVRAPGVKGEGGVVFRVKRLEADVDLWSLIRGKAVVKSVRLDEPLARMSQSVDDKTMNFAALDPKKGDGGPKTIPRIVVRDGMIELGEHTAAGEYTSLRKIPVSGEVARAADQSGAMTISFRELDKDGRPIPGPDALQLSGRFTDTGVTLNLGVLSLSNWPAESMPRPIREAFRRLDLAGEVHRAELTYTYKGGVEASAKLEGVAVSLPLEVRPAEDKDGNELSVLPEDVGKRLRMENVRGDLLLTQAGVEATLRGKVENLEYEVTVKTRGADPDAGFTAKLVSRGIHLTERPEILKFTPPVFRRRLEQFSHPTGFMDAEVTITRDDPVGEKRGKLRAEGVLKFREGTAAFERFTYQFNNMHGEARFNDERIEIVRLEGDSPTGARLIVSGVIEPPTERANVRLNVEVLDLPIDETLRTALKKKGRIIDEMFSVSRYGELVAEGLIAGPGEEGTPDKPAFKLGGIVQVRAVVERDGATEDDDKRWKDSLHITVAEAGVLPKRVPFPMVARNLVIVKTDDTATLEGGEFAGLRGGTGRVAARGDLERMGNPDNPFAPDIEISAEGVPINALTLAAIPRADATGDGELRRQLEALRPTGTLDIEAKVGSDDSGVTYSAEMEATDLSLAPLGEGAAARVSFREAQGSIDFSNTGAAVDLTGLIAGPTGAGSEGRIQVEIGTGEKSALKVAAGGKDFDLALPVEDFIAVFAPEAATSIAQLRGAHAPRGRADVTASVARPQGGEIGVRVGAAALREAALGVGDVAATIEGADGEVSFAREAEAPGLLGFKNFAVALAVGAEPAGRLVANGEVYTDGTPGAVPLTASVTDVRWETGLTRLAIEKMNSPKVMEAYENLKPRGAFGVEVTASRDEAGGRALRAVFRPKTLQLTLGADVVDFPGVEGEVEVTPDSGRMRGLRLTAPTWKLAAEGGWAAAPEGGASLNARVDLEAARLTPDLRAIAPEALRTLFTDLALEVTGPTRIQGATLLIDFAPEGGVGGFKVAGSAAMEGAALEPGVKVTDARGTLDFSAERGGADAPLQFELKGLFDALTVSAIKMTDGRVRVVSGEEGQTLIPLFSAACHGGRVSGDATISGPREAGREYQVTVQASNVRFASLLSDFEATDGTVAAVAAVPGDESADASRGVLDAGFSLAGTIGDEESRRGRGNATVGGGRVLMLPLLVPLTRVTNLELPINEALDYAVADFFVQGSFVNFEELSIFSRSVQIAGFGTVRWPDMALDLRFRPRARNRIPLVTPVLEGIRNELMATVVQGTIKEPDVRVTTMRGTSRFIGRMFGDSADDAEKRLEAIAERGKRARGPNKTDREGVPGTR